VIIVTTCPDCSSENREGALFCDSCGARIDREAARPELQLAPEVANEESPAPAPEQDEAPTDSKPTDDSDVPEPIADSDSGSPEEPEVEAKGDLAEAERDEADDGSEAEEEPIEELPKAGYLVFPDNTEQPIPPSQWLIGRADLAKYLSDAEKANEISRGHVTVFQEGDRFFIEDGKTMVQRTPSKNKTWLVRGSSRILVTGTGRNELQDNDEIDIAELVTLQFLVK
jgi:hypothetical protein